MRQTGEAVEAARLASWLWPVGAVCVGMTVFYAVMANPYRCYGDTPELMTAAVNLGIAHPTGYPLLLLLGKAASVVPLGPLPYRLNLLVGLIGALACGGTCLLLWRAFRDATVAALFSVAFGLTPVMWHNCTNFEVYGLDALFIVAALLLATHLWLIPGAPDGRRRLAALALVSGLGVSHHLTFVAILPAVAWVALRGSRAWRPSGGDLLWAMAAFGLGLLPWVYLPVRGALPSDPYTCWVPLRSLDALIGHMTARQYGPRLFAYAVNAIPVLARRDASAIWEQFGWLLVFVPFGLLALRGAGGLIAEAGLVLAVTNLALFFGYAVGDYEVFFVPSYLGLLVLMAAGTAWLGGWLFFFGGRLLSIAPLLLEVTLSGLEVPSRYAKLRPAAEASPAQYVDSLASTLPDNAIVILGGQWKNLDYLIFPLLYARAVEHKIPGVTFRTAGRAEKAEAAKELLDEIGAPDGLRRQVLAATEEERLRVLLQGYRGPRPLFTDSPRLIEQAKLGGAYCGYLWRITRKPTWSLEKSPDAYLAWARAAAATLAASEAAQDNLATPVLKYLQWLMVTGRLKEARAVARQMASDFPQATEAQFVAASCLSKCGEAAAADQIARKLAVTSPYSSRTYLLRGILLLNQRRFREALTALDVAGSIDEVSDRDDIAFARGACYLGLGDWQAAERAAGPRVWPYLLEAARRDGARPPKREPAAGAPRVDTP